MTITRRIIVLALFIGAWLTIAETVIRPAL
jgi:hypothetical protein